MRYDAPVLNPELAGTNGLVHHNVLWNLPKAMMIKGDIHEIYNNTSFNISGVDLIILDEVYPDPPGGSSNTSTILRNNLAGKISGHRQNPQTPPGTLDHNVYSDTSSSYNSSALLTDPENKNFTPNSSAVELIDAGVIITGITDGYSGSAPDIGAYEVGDSWTAGATWTPNFYPWSTSTSWLGTTNTDWATNSNWDLGVPESSSNAFIPSGLSNYPVVSEITAAVVNNLTVENTASLSIENGGSLIVNGASTGNISYNRTIAYSADNANGWYLVASPTVGETYDDSWIATHDIVSGAGNNRGIGTYNAQTDDWTYYQAGTDSSPFTSGIGYSIKRGSTSGSITFTGGINTADVSASVISAGNGYNLIGNPYPAYINSSSFLTNNTDLLVSETIWLWNSATNNYDAKVTIDDFIVSPGQGFFVQANSDTDLNFSHANQLNNPDFIVSPGHGFFVQANRDTDLNFSHANQLNNADTFQKSTKTEVKLQISDGTNNRYAKIYYVNNATTGFDNGYDGEAFGGIPNTFDIYTHLLSNNEGKKYQIQSLPNKDFETLVVPISIQTEAGKEITFTSEISNLPRRYKSVFRR